MRAFVFPMFTVAIAFAWAPASTAAEPTAILKLWPGKPPGETKAIGPEREFRRKGPNDVKRLTDVGEPSISVYSPPKGKANGAAVLVAPGGGFTILAIEHEGTQTCEWLNSLGVTAVLLKYRVPMREKQTPPQLAAIQDAHRAMSLTRSKAKEWGIDPARIGMLGFSAGGNLTAWTCCHDKRAYDPIDDVDKTPFKPNFAIFVYPGGLLDKGGALKPEFAITKQSPPMCFVHASNDNSQQSVAMYLACKKAGVSAEMHLYATGGHGFGMRKTSTPSASWPNRVGDWLNSRGYLKPTK